MQARSRANGLEGRPVGIINCEQKGLLQKERVLMNDRVLLWLHAKNSEIIQKNKRIDDYGKKESEKTREEEGIRER